MTFVVFLFFINSYFFPKPTISEGFEFINQLWDYDTVYNDQFPLKTDIKHR